MNVGGIVLGVINILIVVAVLLLVGALVLWFCRYMNISVPDMVQKLYVAIVLLIALYLMIALLLGLPGIRIVGAIPYPIWSERYAYASQ